MAPMPDDSVDGMLQTCIFQIVRLIYPPDRIKDVIQNLFEIQTAVHGYLGPETQQQLVRKMYTGPVPFSLPRSFH